jgi:hypothetical protein
MQQLIAGKDATRTKTITKKAFLRFISIPLRVGNPGFEAEASKPHSPRAVKHASSKG